jgi:hypothetical protein
VLEVRASASTLLARSMLMVVVLRVRETSWWQRTPARPKQPVVHVWHSVALALVRHSTPYNIARIFCDNLRKFARSACENHAWDPLCADDCIILSTECLKSSEMIPCEMSCHLVPPNSKIYRWLSCCRDVKHMRLECVKRDD